MSRVNLSLIDSVTHGESFIRDVTDRIRGWKRTIRRLGGYWTGTCEYTGTDSDLLDLFLNGLGYGIRESTGGRIFWEGLIVHMTYTRGGVSWERSLLDAANAVRSIYQSIGDNLLTNGGGESGAWAGYNSPTTVEQSTDWRTEGTYSIHIVAGGASKGAWAGQTISITKLTPYDLRVSCKLVSGSWMLVVVRDDTSAALAEAQTNEVGEIVLSCSIPDDNDYEGTVSIRVETIGGTGEIYCDAAIFNRGAVRAETSWYEDLTSQVEFGRKESVLLRAAMTTEAAGNEAQAVLKSLAWPRSLPPAELLATFETQLQAERGKLELAVAGFWSTLNFRYTELAGTDDASNHVNAMQAECEFVTAGVIEANTMPFQIESRGPVLIGDTLRDIAAAGDVNGDLWQIGVYAGRRLNYGRVPTELSYRYRNGKIVAVDSAPVQPQEVQPGWIHLDDAPGMQPFTRINTFDDARWVFAEEVEFEAPDIVRFRRGDNES